MQQITRIDDDAGAVALAERLNGDRRTRPVVVITVPAGRTAPYIDADGVLDQVGDLAEVFVITSGSQTWKFSNKMPELTQVYGGAGRAYPIGHEWVTRPQASPLRFAFDQSEGERSTRALVSDTLRMAAETGLLRKTARRRRRVEGQVAGIPVPERAVVTFDGGMASIAQELTLPNVPLPQILSAGMTVGGWYDSETRRLDISGSLLDPAVALADYRLGVVVLAEVGMVLADSAELRLHPNLMVQVFRDAVTSNDLDDLRTLMTPGEVLCARVTAVAPSWCVTLLDIDDDDLPLPAASLLSGGPPWLAAPAAEEAHDVWADEPPIALPDVPPHDDVSLTPAIESRLGAPEQEDLEEILASKQETAAPLIKGPTVTLRPSPAMLDRKRFAPPPPEPATAASAAVSTMALTIDHLKAELGVAGRDVQALREDLRAGTAERCALVESRDSQDRQIARLEHELQAQRSRLRKAKQPHRSNVRPGPAFADAAQGFQYAVFTAWATRTPVGEQRECPLPDYALGPDFLRSVDVLDGVSLEKIADVVFEVVTGRACRSAGRDAHRLRESAAATAPHVRRNSDNAVCWRAALQVNSPQARRLHYWILPGGQIELSRVTIHDDFTP